MKIIDENTIEISENGFKTRINVNPLEITYENEGIAKLLLKSDECGAFNTNYPTDKITISKNGDIKFYGSSIMRNYAYKDGNIEHIKTYKMFPNRSRNEGIYHESTSLTVTEEIIERLEKTNIPYDKFLIESSYVSSNINEYYFDFKDIEELNSVCDHLNLPKPYTESAISAFINPETKQQFINKIRLKNNTTNAMAKIEYDGEKFTKIKAYRWV